MHYIYILILTQIDKVLNTPKKRIWRNFQALNLNFIHLFMYGNFH